MEINLSNLKFSQVKSKDKEFDFVEHGIYRGTDSKLEYILNNWPEVVKRVNKLCIHMNNFEKDMADINRLHDKMLKEARQQLTDELSKRNPKEAVCDAIRENITEIKKNKKKDLTKKQLEWQQHIDMPNDPLTKIILKTIDLNWGTKHIFSQVRHSRNSVMKLWNVATGHIEEKVAEKVEKYYDIIDNL